MYVTGHAVQRFRERTGCNKPKCLVIQRILKMYNKAEKVEGFPFGKWIKYGGELGDIYRRSNIYMVVKKDRIITIWVK